MDRAWTREEVRLANGWTPEQWAHAYDHQQLVNCGPVGRLPWTTIIFVQRLCWTYGEEGALIRLNEGRRVAA